MRTDSNCFTIWTESLLLVTEATFQSSFPQLAPIPRVLSGADLGSAVSPVQVCERVLFGWHLLLSGIQS